MEHTSLDSADDDIAHPKGLPPSPVEMTDLVSKIQEQCGDLSAMYSHIVNKTTEEYLAKMVQTVVLDLTLIPVVRSLKGLSGPSDDAQTVSSGFKSIAKTIANLFNKEQHEIESRIVEEMNTFPVDDVRQAYLLRFQNRLN